MAYAENEQQCQIIYQEVLYYNISLGEFIKAILKINAIALEFEKVCLIHENLELLEKVKKFPSLTLELLQQINHFTYKNRHLAHNIN